MVFKMGERRKVEQEVARQLAAMSVPRVVAPVASTAAIEAERDELAARLAIAEKTVETLRDRVAELEAST